MMTPEIKASLAAQVKYGLEKMIQCFIDLQDKLVADGVESDDAASRVAKLALYAVARNILRSGGSREYWDDLMESTWRVAEQDDKLAIDRAS